MFLTAVRRKWCRNIPGTPGLLTGRFEIRAWNPRLVAVTFSPTPSHGLEQDPRPELEREHEPISRRET